MARTSLRHALQDEVHDVSVFDILVERIGRQGPLPVSEVLEVALYHPVHGFYEAGGSAGRRDADFLTSPEVGALFGAIVARALDGWWDEAGRPDPYLVVEAGAGPGTLARMVLAARPECAPALRYVLVDRAAGQRARHGERLELEDPALVLPPTGPRNGTAPPETSPGPIVASLADLPRVADAPAVIVANELLDNLPFDLAERRDGTWHEVRVAMDDGGPLPGVRSDVSPEPGAGVLGGPAGPSGVVREKPGSRVSLVELLVPLDDPRAELLERLAPDAGEGARAPLQTAAGNWLRGALRTAGPDGQVVVFDYGADTADLVRRPYTSWLRTYRRHSRGAGYLRDLGGQDVTCEVAVDQLSAVKAPRRRVEQREWLERWGIRELAADAEEAWARRAHIADLEALTARSRVTEARALLDPAGLGAFQVLEWTGL